MNTILLVLLIVFIILSIVELILLFNIKKECNTKIEDIIDILDKANSDYIKANEIIKENKKDISNIKREKVSFLNELHNLEDVIKTLNNGFTIPSYRNT